MRAVAEARSASRLCAHRGGARAAGDEATAARRAMTMDAREAHAKVEARNVARAAAWVTLEVWGTELIQLLSFTLLARLLGPESYGLVALAMAFVMVPQNMIVHGGWSEALVQRSSLSRRDVDCTFTALALLGVLSAVVLVLLAPLAAHLFALPELAAILAALAICPFLTSLGVVPIGLLQRELKLAPLALRSLLGAGIGGVVALVLALAGMGPWSLVANEILWPLLGAVVLNLAAGYRPQLILSWAPLADIARFARAVSAEQAMILLENFLPRLLLGATAGPAAVGAWALARKMLDLSLELLCRPATRVGLPVLVAGNNAPEERAGRLARVLELPGLIAVPGFVLCWLIGSELIALVFGAQWREAGVAFALLALAGPGQSMAVLLATGFQALGRPDLAARSALFALGAFVVLLALALPWGVLGVAAAFAVRCWILFALRLGLLRSRFGIAPRELLTPLSSRLCAAAVAAFRRSRGCRLGLSCCGCTFWAGAPGCAVRRAARPHLAEHALTRAERGIGGRFT